MRHLFRLILILCGAFAPLPAASSAELITLLTYHKVPPFITGNQTGLTYDLADFLTRKSGKRFVFQVQVLPRKRLDMLLKQDDIMVPWVTPIWFSTVAIKKFKWSNPVMQDGSIYIWKSDHDRSFLKPEDLKGHRLGGVRGYRYVQIDPLVSKGDIRRIDVSTELQLLKMLIEKRVDVSIIPYSAGRFLIQKENWKKDFSYAVHNRFLRHIMTNTSNNEAQEYIFEITGEMPNDKKWQQIMTKYGLTYALKALSTN